MRNTGTIMVIMERGVLVKAMRPNVHNSARTTQLRGSRRQAKFLKRKKRITVMIKKVMGGRLKKSFLVKFARASILMWGLVLLSPWTHAHGGMVF